MLDINITMLIQLVNFLITLVVLNVLLIGPIRHILHQRRQKMNGLLTSAEGFNHAAEARIKAYEQALTEARQEAAEIREQAKAEAASHKQDFLLEASEAAQVALERAQNQYRSEARETMQTLQGQIAGLAQRALSRILA